MLLFFFYVLGFWLNEKQINCKHESRVNRWRRNTHTHSHLSQALCGVQHACKTPVRDLRTPGCLVWAQHVCRSSKETKTIKNKDLQEQPSQPAIENGSAFTFNVSAFFLLLVWIPNNIRFIIYRLTA